MNDEEQHLNETMNPWFSIWVAPRKTTRYLIETKSARYMFIILLVSISGMTNLLDKAVNRNLGDTLALILILLLVLIAGPITGWIDWMISSGISYWIGKWFGGQGTFSELRMAFVASYIPAAFLGLLWGLDFIIIGPALFTKAFDVSIFPAIWAMFSGLITIAVAVWSFVILINAVAEAHRFSRWKAFAAIIVPLVLLFSFAFTFMFIVAVLL